MTRSPAPTELLRQWLDRQLPPPAAAWLREQSGKLAVDRSERTLQISLGMVVRKIGRDDLALTPADLEAAATARPDWDPSRWSVDVATRVLTLACSAEERDVFAERFTRLCRYADLGESIALYSGLPVYPHPEALVDQASEGIRTNMRAVFEAIAHRSPYPRDHFDVQRWNQMVLKALFIGSTLHPVVGLDARANPELARILSDYAHERWAAGRPVSPELWRCLGPFAQGGMLDDLERAAASHEATERMAAALALSASPDQRARRMLAGMPDMSDAIAGGRLNWDALADAMQAAHG